MPLAHNTGATSGGSGDIFLMVKGAKSGLIKGESQDAAHANEIDIVSWTWGMQAKATLGGGSARGKATIAELKVVKRVDGSTTALMAALRSNEMIAKAVLTQRKAGKGQHEFLKVTIEQGRVTALNVEAGDRSGGVDIYEDVSFSFNKITIEYTPQGKDGAMMGSMLYTDSFGDQA